ncbi:terminase gpA endonuclease subunit, partial [Streptomyces brasiliscabiei]|uniref:terminase gpA endonuclease subunit n=1 Tax=Streptomyces brasiliscabiei TaxID=2736302 RepID=UPI003014C457
VYVNTIRGETYKETETEVDWKPLYDRREQYGDDHDGKVPEAVRIILATVDTQDNRMEMTTIGIGEGEEVWLLNRKVFMGQPDNPETLAQLTRALD